MAAQLSALQKDYATLGDSSRFIEVLEEEPRLFALLIEAARPLRAAFGERAALQLRAQYSDDDRLLKVGVRLPADFGADPEQALRSFDAQWWLKNCHRSGGALVFDYEIQDAV